MLIIWRGFGWLVPVILFGGFVLVQIGVDTVFGKGFYTENAWPKHVATITAAVLVGALGWYLNHVRRGWLIDQETGEAIKRAPSHSLFFVPIEYWSVITLVVFLAATV